MAPRASAGLTVARDTARQSSGLAPGAHMLMLQVYGQGGRLAFSRAFPFQVPAVTVTFGGTVLGTPVPAGIEGGTTTPRRPVFHALATVAWDQATRTVTATTGATTVVLTVGQATAQVDGAAVSLAQAPQLVAGATMIPLRLVAQAFGATVAWDPGHGDGGCDEVGAATRGVLAGAG